MFFLKLVWRNAFRAKLRSILTVLALVIALLTAGLMQTVVHAWYAGAEAASGNRLVTRNAISLVFSLPIYYREKIRSIDGVRSVTTSNWFGGVWRDERSFFAQFAVDAATYFPMHPEAIFDPGQYADFLRDRTGCVVGRQLADLYGFNVGDRITLRGTIYQGNWDFTVRAIYDGRDSGTITRTFFFHYDLLNETVKKRPRGVADRVGVFIVDINDPARAAEIGRAIDALFANSLSETLTETEKAFELSFVAMIDTIIQIISALSYIIVFIILAVAANTMLMTARERLSEYATLKALGFGPAFVAALILAESMLITAIGGALAILVTAPVARGFYQGFGKTIFARFDVPTNAYVTQAVAAAAIGLLAALVPMVRSANVKIVDGLRHVG